MPSLSNTAIRSAGRTKSGLLLSLVTRSTKSVIAFLAGRFFHDGSGSSAQAGAATRTATVAIKASTADFIVCSSFKSRGDGAATPPESTAIQHGRLTGW